MSIPFDHKMAGVKELRPQKQKAHKAQKAQKAKKIKATPKHTAKRGLTTSATKNFKKSMVQTSFAPIQQQIRGAKISTKNVKQDNAHSYHPPIFQARPLKANISNLFDNRADYTRDVHGFCFRLEIDHDGQNIDQDIDEKTTWIDKHMFNEWHDIMMDRFCPSVSKKAKQHKPSNFRQSRARKLLKQSREKVLATNIRDAIDNTPRYSGFQGLLADNKKVFGTYNPTDRDLINSGLDLKRLPTHLSRTFPDRNQGV